MLTTKQANMLVAFVVLSLLGLFVEENRFSKWHAYCQGMIVETRTVRDFLSPGEWQALIACNDGRARLVRITLAEYIRLTEGQGVRLWQNKGRGTGLVYQISIEQIKEADE